MRSETQGQSVEWLTHFICHIWNELVEIFHWSVHIYHMCQVPFLDLSGMVRTLQQQDRVQVGSLFPKCEQHKYSNNHWSQQGMHILRKAASHQSLF